MNTDSHDAIDLQIASAVSVNQEYNGTSTYRYAYFNGLMKLFNIESCHSVMADIAKFQHHTIE